MERQIRGPGDGVLSTGFVEPGAVLVHTIVAEYELAYRTGRLGYDVPTTGSFEPPPESEETGEITPYSDASYIPCMTAIAIEHMKRGAGNLSRYKQKPKYPGAE